MNNNYDSNSLSSEWIRIKRTRQYRNALQQALEAHTQYLAHPRSKVTMIDRAVKKSTSQNLWPRISSNEFINWNRTKRGFKKLREVRFFFAASAANVWKHDISSASKKAYPGVLGHFWGCSTPSKRSVLLHKNSVASCQQCRHVVEPRALTCTFKHSDLIAWSLLSWHPTHKYLWGRLCFVQVCCLLYTVTVTPAETQIMSTEALLSKTVSVKIHTKVHMYDLAFHGVHAHPSVAVRNRWRR